MSTILLERKIHSGLPYFFAQKVRLDIANNEGTIDYPSLTYGNIISSINKKSLWLYNDLRLKNQIEKEKRYTKKELETFCEKYDFDPLIAPFRKRRKEKKDFFLRNKRKMIELIDAKTTIEDISIHSSCGIIYAILPH